MNKSLIVFFLLFFSATSSKGQVSEKIKVYFTHPVNTLVSTGVNAAYLNNSMDDTLVAYISRAKYTIDIAVYNYQQTTGMADIAAAVNNAVANGVVVRWIFESSQSNSGMSTLSSAVHTFGSPTSAGYGIMHNKFMIIDANSTNINEPLVWTGSTNWTKTHFNSNVNTSVIIQDKNMAAAFLAEFNEMWGGAGVNPDAALSKFGPFKSDNTVHSFNIGGTTVELYFSPTDGTNSKVLDAISSANTDLYFGMLAFSLDENSDSIISKNNSGTYVLGIIDQTSQIYSPYSSLSASLGSNLKVYSDFVSVFHSKNLIIDPCNFSSDPTTVTGSYNWTNPASTENDENILIIHSDTIANIFYQSFYQNFSDLGSTPSPCSALEVVSIPASQFEIYPTINDGEFFINWKELNSNNVKVELFDYLGRKAAMSAKSGQPSEGVSNYSFKEFDLKPGIYFVHVHFDLFDGYKKIIIR